MPPVTEEGSQAAIDLVQRALDGGGDLQLHASLDGETRLANGEDGSVILFLPQEVLAALKRADASVKIIANELPENSTSDIPQPENPSSARDPIVDHSKEFAELREQPRPGCLIAVFNIFRTMGRLKLAEWKNKRGSSKHAQQEKEKQEKKNSYSLTKY
ncbi:MAG: hypothetical protein H6774_04530 [Pseudomonadales bacterium]|nr:hypothetical protein [Pseudomonadales bacterium]